MQRKTDQYWRRKDSSKETLIATTSNVRSNNCEWCWRPNYSTGLLKWRTAVRIRTFGWRRPDLVSLWKEQVFLRFRFG